MAIRTIMTRIFSALLVAALSLAGATSASACEPVCHYERVITYVCHMEPYQVCVMRYDHCGERTPELVTRYRKVHTPVVNWVKVYR